MIIKIYFLVIGDQHILNQLPTGRMINIIGFKE